MKKIYFFGLVFLFGASGVFAGLFLSTNGIRELYEMKKQIDRTRIHIVSIERDNQELRRRLNLALNSDRDALEHHFRIRLGMLKSEEWLYLEPR
jgi:hypothetical protein